MTRRHARAGAVGSSPGERESPPSIARIAVAGADRRRDESRHYPCPRRPGRSHSAHPSPPSGRRSPLTIRIERDPPGPAFALLLREYAASLSFDLAFQGFEQELAGLPAPYAPPGGARLLAYVGDDPAGCVALRHFADRTAELKRLYLRPAHRRLGLGRRLTEEALAVAGDLGYGHVRLDTTPEMAAAHALYRSLGFREIAAYRPNPVPGTCYFELELAPER
jgi:putative acetyltransferase